MHPIMAQELGRVRMEELRAEASRARLARQVKPARRHARPRFKVFAGRVRYAFTPAPRTSARSASVRRAPAAPSNC